MKWCIRHKRSNDICLQNRCQYEGCDISANYGNISDRKRKWCTRHKQIDDIHISNHIKENTERDMIDGFEVVATFPLINPL